MEKDNKTPRNENSYPFTKSFLTPRSPNEHDEDIISSDSENERDKEEEKSISIEPDQLVNNELINSRTIINSVKTTLTENKGKISISQKEKIIEGMDELFDIIAHLVAEKNLIKGELKILRPLSKKITQNLNEFKQIMEENKSLVINMNAKNDEIKKDFLKEKMALMHKTATTPVAGYQQNNPPLNSYAAITAFGRSSHAVIISATDKTRSTSDIKAILRQDVKPSELKVGINSLIAAKDNKVIIKCQTSNDANKIRAAIPGLTNGNLVAYEGKRLRPNVILKGIEKETQDSEILDMILQQNDTIYEATGNDKEAIKIQRFTNNRKNDRLRNVILIVKKEVHSAMLKQERINIGFQRVRVEDSCPIMQCYKCMGYGHFAARCTESKDRCLHCAGEHKSSDCTKKEQKEEFRCWNCFKMAKGKIEAPKHRSNDRDCPYRTIMMLRTMERVDYG